MLFKVKDTAIKNGKKTTVTVNTESSELMNFLLGKDNKNPKDTMDAVFNEANQTNKKDVNAISKNKELDSSVILRLEAPKARDKPKSKKKKPSLSRKAVTGKAIITHNSRNLSEQQIRFANYNSFYDKGNNHQKAYEAYRRDIEFSGLSEKQKQRLLDQLYKRYEPILRYDSQWVSPMVSGPANYPQAKMDRIMNSMMKANDDFLAWWNSIEPTLNKSYKTDDKNIEEDKSKSVKEIKEKFYARYNSLLQKMDEKEKDEKDLKYDMDAILAQYYVSDALKVDTELYKELFNKLNDLCHFSKNSNFYKTYKKVELNELSAEKIQEQEAKENEVLFKCADYEISKLKIRAGNRIAIKFAFKVKPQLIYALKKRGYTWYSYGGCWICRPEKFDIEWAKNISKQYEKYL